MKFLSLEPLLGPLEPLDLSGIDWVIVGASPARGRGRWTRPGCTRSAIAARRRGVPFFFKQWGGTQKKRAGRLLEGRTWDEMPRAAVR